MDIRSIYKPCYIYRPRQIFVRLYREALRLPPGSLRQVTLPWGLNLRVDITEHIGQSIWRTGLYDITVSEAIWRLLNEGATAIDVGANIGYTTSIMARRVGRTGRVLSFEPHPGVLEHLRYNVELFQRCDHIGDIQLFDTALSDSHGESVLVSDEAFAGNYGLSFLASAGEHHDRGIRVETSRLDDLVDGITSISLMKVDVEGHELQVLRGAERLLHGSAIRNIIYEDHRGPHSEVHHFLARHGYTSFALGWKMSGPVLGSLESPLTRNYEPASFVATLEPDAILEVFGRRGWSILRA